MKKTLFMVLVLVLPICIYAQEISYEYDKSGNRIEKKIIELTKSLRQVDETKFFSDEIAKRTIKIYPNPTKGQLAVEISDFESVKSAELTIYTFQGVKVLSKKANSSYTDLDISSRSNGIYLLHISIDGKISSWKIMKN